MIPMGSLDHVSFQISSGTYDLDSKNVSRSAASKRSQRLHRALSARSVQSFDFSSGLFSFGFTVERTTMNLLSMSNQKGAPREIARAVSNQPRK